SSTKSFEDVQDERDVAEKSTDCPRKRFVKELVEQLERWRAEGDRLAVCLDANQNVYKKELDRALTDIDGLGMVEAVGAFTGVKLGATYFCGSKPIDAVWTTGDLEVVNACMMPVGYGVGDHRMFALDFTKTSFLGSELKKIIRPQARRLNTLIDGATETYVDQLEDLCEHHKIAPKLITAHRDAPDSESARNEVSNADKLSEDLMKNAERKCRKLKNGHVPFSPESSIWIRRCQVYRSLLRFKAGKIRNRGNLKRA
ncbi:hypothetical protein ACHAWF_000220, partial [Thalassiosira exigua]